MAEIDLIFGRQILDSRGNPTIEADVRLRDGAFGRKLSRRFRRSLQFHCAGQVHVNRARRNDDFPNFPDRDWHKRDGWPKL